MTGAALFVGDVCWDVRVHVGHIPAPDEKVCADATSESVGGVTANAAVACALAGVASRAVMRFGSDRVGREARTQLKDRGIRLEASMGDGATCVAVVVIEPHGEKRLMVGPGDSMYPTAAAVSAVDLAGVDWVHTAVYDKAAASLLVSRCRAAGIPWSLDIEPATFAHGVDDLTDHIDGAEVVFCNARAAKLIGPDPGLRLIELGSRAVVFTRGRSGACWLQADRPAVPITPMSSLGVKVVDTSGAGDCLAGWFIAERLRGSTPIQALTAAVVAATLSCGLSGAQPSFPTRSAVAVALGAV
ncbi:MAG: carbohydrate kinase family protein [Candidatus Dormibacteria bacterium]